MLRSPPTSLDECSAALVHRMLKSDALPSHLQSVVNGRGELTSSAEELESVMVGVALTLAHLAVCKAPDDVSFRAAQKLTMINLIDCDPATSRWLRVLQHLPLTDLLTRLFPPPPGAPNDLHITRVMCGVFSTRQANAALKQIGGTNAKHGRQLMQQLRLCCLHGLHQHFNALKIALL